MIRRARLRRRGGGGRSFHPHADNHPFVIAATFQHVENGDTCPFVCADQLTEGPETLGLTLSAPGAALGAQFTTTVNIADTSVTSPVPPVPPPFFSGALTIPGGVVLAGAGVQGGIAFLPLPLGSAVFFADINGDGKGDVVFFLPGLVAALDGQTGQLFALATDLTGDGITDFQVFNPDGSTTRLDGRTGMIF